ncbi:hypothetical protein [Pelagibacterium montanilacus]|uniref:hypothetical protein n=1 Tax=Pelagibacterium montanilacus TaxID=2185280 RepID=UPI000F8F283D|nr:hypothetical protein [Pelagibacterium montanilacus]
MSADKAQRDELVSLEVFVHRRTPGDKGGLLVSPDGNEDLARWIPKSQVTEESVERAGQPNRGGRLVDYMAVLTLPRWLAESRGLDPEHRAKGTDDLFGGT